MNPPPPPPPPHGSNSGAKGSGLPSGNYDIFIIPPHSSGSGFLYLPSLQTHRNSFLAGVGCTILAVAIWSIVFPVLREWFATIVASGGMAVVALLVGVGVAGWAWGKTQTETGRPSESGTGSASSTAGNSHSSGYTNGFPTGGSGPQPPPQSTHQPTPQSTPHPPHEPPPQPPPPQPPPPPPPPPPQEPPQEPPSPQHPPPPEPAPPPEAAPPPKSTWERPAAKPDTQAPPKPTWQRSTPGPTNSGPSADSGATKGAWEKAREETRKKEEERKRAEDLKKRVDELRKKREEDEKEKVRQREKDARERIIREAREKREKEAREKEAREAREKREKEREKERQAREKARTAQPSTAGTESSRAPSPSPRKSEDPRPASPTKRHQQPTAKTATEDDVHSFRPYDKPKRPVHAAKSVSSIYSESSYAPSFSTSRTTPPPSNRGPYHSKDPDKIVLKAVYSFNNTFTRTPIAQLVSGVGSVTDGLILRITTEGLFIDDDVRGVPQREWDVKAWTLKLVEVWCPHLQALGASSGSAPVSSNFGIFGKKGTAKVPSTEESDFFLSSLSRDCKSIVSRVIRVSVGNRSDGSASKQSGESKGLHVLRASIRDQEGKRYVFVLQEEEGWKVAIGLQRLRRGTQVRALGVSGMAANETRGILENMGWV